jgi:hypothetical protein
MISVYHVGSKAAPESLPSSKSIKYIRQLVPIGAGYFLEDGALVALPYFSARCVLCNWARGNLFVVRIVPPGHRAFRLGMHCHVNLDGYGGLGVCFGEPIYHLPGIPERRDGIMIRCLIKELHDLPEGRYFGLPCSFFVSLIHQLAVLHRHSGHIVIPFQTKT